ncbi:MAG: PIG-L family deacetylase, partial [Thermoleophilia bacterium]|nr:PIG-L family deacetylase [Thermoleophilia bacterium]
MHDDPLRILIIGAHPDDADIKAGGTAALWAERGHDVRLVSLTDGSAGHHEISGPPLAARRRAEAAAAASKIGVTYDVLDIPDGQLDDRLEYRYRLIRMIRDFRADLVVTHRTNDYHPDHRFAGLLVQDASYMLTVPAVCPESPHLPAPPVIMLFSDAFQRPNPFRPDVAVAIDGVVERVVDMLDCHVSQFYEWLPYNAGHPEAVPASAEGRRAWLGDRYRERIRPLARQYRDLVADKKEDARRAEAK